MAQVGIIMGSQSDFDTMKEAVDILDSFSVSYELKVVSAHRTPNWMFEYSQSAEERGLDLIIAGAGGAAHLPGMVASITPLPVIGVPIQSKALKGLDSLLSIVQMPGGVPVATMAIGKAGAKNAGLYAVALLGLKNSTLRQQLKEYRKKVEQDVLAIDLESVNSNEKD